MLKPWCIESSTLYTLVGVGKIDTTSTPKFKAKDLTSSGSMNQYHDDYELYLLYKGWGSLISMGSYFLFFSLSNQVDAVLSILS